MEYKAIDGKIFESQEECEVYECYPRLWTVKYRSFGGGDSISKVFLTNMVGSMNNPVTLEGKESK